MRWILTIDLSRLIKSVWEKHGRTPAELYQQFTPTQFFAVFMVEAGRTGSGAVDKDEALRQYNDERGTKGLRPVVPEWA